MSHGPGTARSSAGLRPYMFATIPSGLSHVPLDSDRPRDAIDRISAHDAVEGHDLRGANEVGRASATGKPF